jgi:hypothetical protein
MDDCLGYELVQEIDLIVQEHVKGEGLVRKVVVECMKAVTSFLTEG